MNEKQRKAHNEAVKRYKKKAQKNYLIQLNRNTDDDIIKFLDSLENKNGFLKQLIRNVM